MDRADEEARIEMRPAINPLPGRRGLGTKQKCGPFLPRLRLESSFPHGEFTFPGVEPLNGFQKGKSYVKSLCFKKTARLLAVTGKLRNVKLPCEMSFEIQGKLVA